MAARAALRCGVGLVQVAVEKELYPILAQAVPEAVFLILDLEAGRGAWEPKLLAALNGCSACLIGCGLGGLSETLCPVVLAHCEKPLVVDADGLNFCAKHPEVFEGAQGPWVLTPHPGEMARLTGLSMEEIKGDPAAVARTYAKAWGCTVLLKGHRTAIAGPDEEFAWNQSGNAGLAKGGSGDVLTGMILALLGQKLRPFAAACVGSYLLGASAEMAFGLLQERMLMARDVIGAVEETLESLWKPAPYDGTKQNEEN